MDPETETWPSSMSSASSQSVMDAIARPSRPSAFAIAADLPRALGVTAPAC
jgi:hypothetical protein